MGGLQRKEYHAAIEDNRRERERDLRGGEGKCGCDCNFFVSVSVGSRSAIE